MQKPVFNFRSWIRRTANSNLPSLSKLLTIRHRSPSRKKGDAKRRRGNELYQDFAFRPEILEVRCMLSAGSALVTPSSTITPLAAIDVSTPTTSTLSYSETGTWTSYPAGYAGTERFTAAGDGSATASYTFSGLASGQYQVLLTWQAYSNRGTTVPYTFSDGNTQISATTIDQQLSPDGAVSSGWQLDATVNISSGTLVVTPCVPIMSETV